MRQVTRFDAESSNAWHPHSFSTIPHTRLLPPPLQRGMSAPIPAFLRTHPLTEDRVRQVESDLQQAHALYLQAGGCRCRQREGREREGERERERERGMGRGRGRGRFVFAISV